MNSLPRVAKTHRNGRDRTEADYQRAYVMYLTEAPLEDIAAEMHVSIRTIGNWRRLRGWRPRQQRVREGNKNAPKPIPLVWRCPCDPRQLHKASECCKRCGGVPAWAQAG